ncbi:MAG: Tim44/TimA family putative adaptor protein [Pseudomonadota bacterium]
MQVYLDILIFGVIAGFLIYRLNSVLGTRRGDERPRPNPFATPEIPPRPILASLPPKPLTGQKPLRQADGFGQLIDAEANKDGRIESGLEEIAAADPSFELEHFMAGAGYAFDAIVAAYGAGDRDSLKSLLSPKLYADFEAGIRAREEQGPLQKTEESRIRAARIVEAHLGGTMAYITVDYDVEQMTAGGDKADTDTISSVKDIWTFTRDIRSSDPNWILIETRTAGE